MSTTSTGPGPAGGSRAARFVTIANTKGGTARTTTVPGSPVPG